MKKWLPIVATISIILLAIVGCQTADPAEDIAESADVANNPTTTPFATQPSSTELPPTETAVSLPTPLPATATNIPPTATAVTTDATDLNRRQLFALLSGYDTAVYNEVTLIQQQLTNPQLDNPAWINTLTASANTIHNSYTEILNIQVPRQGTQPHQRAADAIAVCETASTLILEAAIAADLAQVNQVAADLAGCAEELLSLNNAFAQGNGSNGGQQGNVTPVPTFEARGCDDTSIGFTPLIDLGQELYQGFEGGLYLNGSNNQPAEHEAAGLTLAEQIKPIDGNIVILSIGMSNVRQEFDKLIEVSKGDTEINPQILLVNGAVSGRPAQTMDEESDQYWELVDKKLSQASKTPDDVQIVWLKQAHAYPGRPFPADAQIFQSELQSIVRIIGTRYPNVKMIYLSSRTYAGYASANLHPEPYAYQSGFSVKWLIEDYINGTLPEDIPWLAWGPYLWADGTTGRSDDFIWECDDVIGDGTHPGDSGREKVAQLWLQFFKNNSTTRTWFLRQP